MSEKAILNTESNLEINAHLTVLQAALVATIRHLGLQDEIRKDLYEMRFHPKYASDGARIVETTQSNTPEAQKAVDDLVEMLKK